ncbi:hypothetical protein ACROYT_G041044 [Oculina patagonica]
MAKLRPLGICLIICWFHQGPVSGGIAVPNEGDIRLVDGGAPSQGRVEIYINDSWSTVCDHWFGYNEGRVVCKQLGLPELSDVHYGAPFGQGNGSILKEQYNCQENDTSLLNCSKTGYISNYCSHGDDVGISCGPLVAAECGGLVTEPVGYLVFKEGEKVNENECQWNIGDTSEPTGDRVILVIDPVEHCRSAVSVRDRFGMVLLDRYCGPSERSYLNVSSLNVTVKVKSRSKYYPFTARYVILNGSIDSALQVDGWNITVVNVSQSSITFQWPNLTDVLGNEVLAYGALVETTSGEKASGDIVSLNVTSIRIDGLKGATEYRVFAVAVDVLGQPHRSSQVWTSTEEGVPSRSPYFRHIEDKYIKVDSINISISLIPEKYHNGILLGYTISYDAQCSQNSSGQVTVSASTTSYVLTGLLPGTQYYIRVAGFTSTGSGPNDGRYVYTTCLGQTTLTGINGTLHSPNYPCYYGGLQYCRWTIEPQLSGNVVKAIWIEFNAFGLTGDAPNCRSEDWLGVETGENAHIDNDTLLCDYIGPFSLVVHGDQAKISFRTHNRYSNNRGFSAWYLGLRDPFIDIHLSSWHLSVHNITSSSARVEWADFPVNVFISHFMVMFTEENKNISFLFKVNSLSDRSYNVQKLLKPHRMYKFHVLAFTGSIDNETYSTEMQSVLTGEGAPSGAPTNVRARNFQLSYVLVLWDAVKPEDANGQIQGYTVYYREYRHYYYSDHAESVNITDPNVFQLVLSGLDAGRKYQIAVSAFTSEGEGPRSPWLSITVGCGGNFNQSFGRINISKSDYGDLRCNWTISSVGISNAVLLLSMKQLYFDYCWTEFLKVYSSSGSEIFSLERCSANRPGVVELQFSGGDFLTVQTYLFSRYSRLEIEFVVIRRGLQLALSPSTTWNIHGYNTSQTSLFVDWSNVPGNLQVDFFILSMNQTRPYVKGDERDNGRTSFLRIVNSSTTLMNVSNLPVFSQHIVRVYLVDVNGDVYKSERIVVETDEGVPRRGPYLYSWDVNVLVFSISFTRGDIDPEDAQGRVLGYVVKYATINQPNVTKTITFDTNTTRITLRNLTEGTTYLIAVAGFTSKGTGQYRPHAATLCGGYLTEDSDYFSSPNYPNSPHNFDEHFPIYDRETRCFWNINPRSDSSMIWLTFADLSLGRRYDDNNCGGGVRISAPSNEDKNDKYGRFLLDVCGQITNETLLIEGGIVNLHTDGFEQHKYDSRLNHSRILAHYRSEPGNITTIIGEELNSWTGIQANASSSSIDLSWTSPPGGLRSVSTVQQYLILFNTIPSRGFYRALWLPADKTHVMISGLRPFTNHSLIVVAIFTDESIRENTGWFRVPTEEGVPTRSAYILYARAIDHSTIDISWERIPQRDVGGILRGYHIYISLDYYHGLVRNITVGPDIHEARITGLQSYTAYIIWVKPFTSKGESRDKNERWIRTKCGSALHNSSGVIQSPGFPRRVEYSECTWDIYPEDGNKSVLLTFGHFDLPLSFKCEEFYVSVRDDSGIKPELICGERGPFTFLAHKFKIDYKSTRYTEIGSGFLALYIVLNESLVDAPLVDNWNINISSVMSSSISVMWTHYVPDNSYSLQLYAVVCTPTNQEAGPIVATANKTETNLEVRRLRALTEYSVQVLALTLHTDSGALSLKGSEKLTVSTPEGVPSEPPGNFTALSPDSSRIIVSWTHIPDGSVNGMLQGYKVFYRSLLDDGNYSTITVGPATLQAIISENLIYTDIYEVRVAGFTSVGVGVMSESVPVQPGCMQGFVNDSMGVITSPGFPEKYPSKLLCYWIVLPQYFKYRLVFAFDTFHTENVEGRPNCTNFQNDYIQAGNLHNILRSNPYCGIRNPFAVILEANFTNYAGILFKSNDQVEEQGFNVSYFAVNKTSKISISIVVGSITGHEVTLTWLPAADNYIVLYKPSNVRREWKFKRTRHTQVTLRSLRGLTEYTVTVVGYSSSQETYGSQDIKFKTLNATEPETTTPLITTPTPEPITLMYPYGVAAGDSVVAFDISERKCFKIPIPDGGMAFFGKRHRKLHICPNGVIQFERERINRWPYKFGQRYWLRDDAMLAPYWSNVDFGSSFVNGPSKVFYHVYSDSMPSSNITLSEATEDVMKLLKRPLATNFTASWVLVVTWEKLRPREYNSQNLLNTFQCVIITDGVYSFVMYNYPVGGIQWSAPTSVSNYIHYTNYRGLPVMGWNAGDSDGKVFNYIRSETVGMERIDSLQGNTNIIGKWFFRLENSKGEQDAIQKCLRWFKNQPDPSSYSDSLEPCPCTLRQGVFDERFQFSRIQAPYTYCVYTRFPSSANRGRECCYNARFDGLGFGALIVGNPGGGVIDRYHKFATRTLRLKHQLSDVLGFKYCCVQSKLCERYYRKRPSEGCENYRPPVWSWLWGDPHFVTLDGQNYTFNGLGEYTMVNAKDGRFELQARTKLAKGGGTATVFVAAVAKEENTSAVQVALKDGGGLEVLVDGEEYQGFDGLTNTSVNLNGSVAVSCPQNNSFLVTFPSGISVTVTEIQESLSIVFAAPEAFKGYTKGLLGTWNDNPLDDFLRPDGTTLASNATGREIHFSFGLKWQVLSNTSLFTYKPGENISTFSNVSFVPIFLDENITFASEALRKEAEAVCQGDVNCLFDIASTGDTSVGESTKQVSVQLESENEELHNFPPTILSGPTEVNLTVNTTVSITVTAEDPNGDPMTFNVTGSLPKGALISTNASSVTLTWNVTTQQIEVEFVVADDSNQATVLRPVINVCACHNQGTCIPVDENDVDSSGGRFNILSCVCQNGYTGTFCDADLDACEENFQPCYPGVECIDLKPPANESGFECGSCPVGLTGNGVECTDLDECATNKGGCEHNCVNTHGSFLCTCNSGYRLNLDEKSCDDVDECSPVSDCMQICENTMGSYNCKCNADFKVDPNDPKNCIPKDPCQQNSLECQHICFLSDGNEKCACNAGYALEQDGKTCTDVDECATGLNNCDQQCSNNIGGYSCSCVDGFTLDGNGFTCNDVDECVAFTFNCTDDSQICQNTHGSYKCVCGEGLYWINNTCQGLDKGAKPPPPPPAPVPRTPSDEERSQSVNLEIQGLNISQWNQPLEEAFKAAVATAATKHCSETDNCKSTPASARRKRAATYIIFTEDQVHILPGYPKQISEDPLLAILAFYLQFPPGTSGDDAIKKDALVAIVKGSLADISNSINANISSVQTLIAETSTATPTTSVASTRPTEKDDSSSKMKYIIAGSVAGGVLLIIVIVVIVWRCSKPKNRIPKRVADISDKTSKLEMDTVAGIPHGVNEAFRMDSN